MKTTIFQNLILALLIAVVSSAAISLGSEGVLPIADAGLSRYAAQDPVVLDGTGSYDPDNSGPLSYTWRQISGPTVVISDADTATPRIIIFIQTDEIQECEFELIVSVGELTSLPDTVKVIIVPDFGENLLELENDSFDPHKPTIIYFGGGDCTNGLVQNSACPLTDPGWLEKANIISFPKGYAPDPGTRTYYQCGDMILVYLSAVAPNYRQPIQTSGWSTGGQPAIDVGRYLNLTYQDRRYAINRVTFFDATPYCRDYSERISDFLGSSVDGEQCWIDNYVSSSAWSSYTKYPYFYNNVLNIWFEKGAGSSASGSTDWLKKHQHAMEWYNNSLSKNNMNDINSGVVAGASWSVIGPGKNLQLASTPDNQIYKFQWYGWNPSGYMDFYDEAKHTGKLPEPVTIVGLVDVGEPNGGVLTCEESENAVGYQLLFGSDPYRVMDYNIFSDTPYPPNEVITTLPFDETWWTVRVRDQYGSTIYADPIYISVFNLSFPIENPATGKKYSYLQDAIDEASPGDEIVVKEGIHHEKINFRGKNLTVRSTDPNDSAVVASTIITGDGNNNLVTFSGGEDINCVLAGFTITGGKRGIYCSGASPTITNCTIAGNVNADIGAGMYIKDGSSPTLVNCMFSSNSASLMGGGIQNVDSSPILINCTFTGNSAAVFGGGIYCAGGSPTLTNCILWGDIPEEISILRGTPVITYSDIQGGFTGEGNIDADPLFANPDIGDYYLKSQVGRWDPAIKSWIIDDVTSPCIDAGDPSTQASLEPLHNGGIINMGAYGGTSKASKSP